MSDEGLAPIVIKRKKVVAGGGHHGGAWKVAYADFVTAMMAFFLIMWLLNATTEKQRKGLADYFAPTVPVSRVSGGGEDAFWGDSMFDEDSLAFNERGATRDYPPERRGSQGDPGRIEGAEAPPAPGDGNRTGAEELLEDLVARGGESMAALQEMRHVVTRLTEDGLVIDIHALPGAPLFQAGTARPTMRLETTLAVIGDLLRVVTNDVSVAAHVPSLPVVAARNTAWDDTAARALAARRSMEAAGFPAARVRRVTGHADRTPIDGNPMALRNDRVEVTVLREGV